MAGPKAIAQYEQVRNKVDAGLPVLAAIKAVAAETGVSAGTTQTAYYRVAKETGVVKPRKARKSAKSRAVAATRAVAKPTALAAPKRRAVRTKVRTSAVGEPTTAELLRQFANTAAALGARVEQLERDSARLREIEAALGR